MLLSVALWGLLLAVCIGQINCATPNCLDDNGRPVDWYIVYKFPVLRKSSSPFDTGYAYAYMTSNDIGMKAKARKSRTKNIDGQWKISDKLITDPDSMVLNTLSIAYDDKSENFRKINSIFYNDHPPTSEEDEEVVTKNQRRAHAKGAVVVDETSGDGFWLSHSTPQFPQLRTEKLEYAGNSRVNGQTFMCLNFDLNESGREIFEHLLNMRPLVYESHISDELMSWMPELSSLEPDGFKGERSKPGDGRLAQVIRTRGGQELSIYSKSGSFKEDFFASWLNEELDTSLYVETWRIGRGSTLNSTCPLSEPHINNVAQLRVVTDDVNINWSYTQDHSKWAISDSVESGVVCIGDMNRAKSQFIRGGGAICIQCPKCWNIFSRSILELEPCPKKVKD